MYTNLSVLVNDSIVTISKSLKIIESIVFIKYNEEELLTGDDENTVYVHLDSIREQLVVIDDLSDKMEDIIKKR